MPLKRKSLKWHGDRHGGLLTLLGTFEPFLRAHVVPDGGADGHFNSIIALVQELIVVRHRQRFAVAVLFDENPVDLVQNFLVDEAQVEIPRVLVQHTSDGLLNRCRLLERLHGNLGVDGDGKGNQSSNAEQNDAET